MELCLTPRIIRGNHLFPNTSMLLILYVQTIILEEVSAKVTMNLLADHLIGELNVVNVLWFIYFRSTYGVLHLI